MIDLQCASESAAYPTTAALLLESFGTSVVHRGKIALGAPAHQVSSCILSTLLLFTSWPSCTAISTKLDEGMHSLTYPVLSCH
eukprot:1157312-Pelagomonas_calceolata.AAC.7